ncbi:3122_t:CDS:2 [Gigaspora margarita]|uniref:3122_t:CDS:1 n=1 Tax=Gigaspora margarita TaxID=4874 RepID=A0ABN7UY10_GIGMA|nr:3122_t:CDS:2 [Gigaspora margarita]
MTLKNNNGPRGNQNCNRAYKCSTQGNNNINNSRPAIIENERTRVLEAERTSNFKLKNAPCKGESAFNSEIPSLDPLFETLAAAKRRKKNDGKAEKVETPELNKKENKDHMHKVIKKARVRLDWEECELMIRDGKKKIKIPTKYCKPTNINKRIEKKRKSTKVKKEPEEDESTLEEKAKSEIDESDSDKEYEKEVLSPEYETIYLNEEREKEDFNIGPMTAQHEIYTEDGPLIKQKFYPTSRPEYEFIKTEIQHMEKDKIHEEFCKIHSSFIQIIEETNPFKWRNEQQITFEKLKTILVMVPVLAHSNDNKEYILYTDISHLALGAILAQHDEYRKEHVIEYATREEILYRVNKQKEVQIILEAVHESAIGGHMGEKVTIHKTYIQKLATILELDEIVILDQSCVILHTLEQEASEQIVLLERRTPAEKIRENLYTYLQDLNQGELDKLVLSTESLREDWDKKLVYTC